MNCPVDELGYTNKLALVVLQTLGCECDFTISYYCDKSIVLTRITLFSSTYLISTLWVCLRLSLWSDRKMWAVLQNCNFKTFECKVWLYLDFRLVSSEFSLHILKSDQTKLKKQDNFESLVPNKVICIWSDENDKTSCSDHNHIRDTNLMFL